MNVTALVTRDSSRPRDGSGRVRVGKQRLRVATTDEVAATEAVRQYEEAPKAVRDAFWKQLASQSEAEREFNRHHAELEAGVDYPEPPSRSLPREPVVWDERWARRSRKAKHEAVHGRSSIRSEADAIKAIPLADAIERLTGEELRRGVGSCPFPDHEDSSPSFSVGDHVWTCFACNKSGNSIYDLAAELWQLETRGSQFVELHQGLREVLA